MTTTRDEQLVRDYVGPLRTMQPARRRPVPGPSPYRRRAGKVVLGCAVAAAAVAVLALMVIAGHSSTAPKPAKQRQGVFGQTHGWIAIGGRHLMLFDPDHPGHHVVLADSLWAPAGGRAARGGVRPIAWSRDGSELLLNRGQSWYVLNDTGRLTRIATGRSLLDGGSFTADGSAVVYEQDGAVYRVSASGGARHRIVKSSGQDFRIAVGNDLLSPDGTTIVYAHSGGRNKAFWLADSSGSHARPLVSYRRIAAQPGIRPNDELWMLSWLPGGRLLLIANDEKVINCHLFTISQDGSDLRRWGPPGLCAWSATLSPDGRRVALLRGKARAGRIMLFNTSGTASTVIPWKDASVGAPYWLMGWRP